MDTIKPVKRYRTPNLPTAGVLTKHPELLHVVPRRWINNTIVLQALAISSGLLLTNCQTNEQSAKLDNNLLLSESPKVAPVFFHGSSRANFAGLPILPYIYLSEEEACDVINDEAKLFGIDFNKGNQISLKTEYSCFPEKRKENQDLREYKDSIQLDINGHDTDKHISYVCVCVEKNLFPLYPDSNITDYYERPRDMIYDALILRQSLIKSCPLDIFVVFYTPIEKLDLDDFKKFCDIRQSEDESKPLQPSIIKEYVKMKEQDLNPKSSEFIRLQVRDFIEWLKAQGVI